MSGSDVQIVDAERGQWRCGGPCAVRPLLAMFASTGGVYIKVSGVRAKPTHYIADLQGGPVRAHCPSCHSWRELYYDADTKAVRERAWAGPFPIIECPCIAYASAGPAFRNAR